MNLSACIRDAESGHTPDQEVGHGMTDPKCDFATLIRKARGRHDSASGEPPDYRLTKPRRSKLEQFLPVNPDNSGEEPARPPEAESHGSAHLRCMIEYAV
jgi:hypothetical protein